MKALPGWARSRAIVVAVAMVVTGCQLIFGDFKFSPQEGGTGGFVGSVSAAGGSSLPADCNIEGVSRCNGSMLEFCSSKRWVGDRDCVTQSQCDAEHARCKTCIPNTFRCEGSRLMQCASGGENWNVKTSCETSCDAQNGRCTTCMVDQAICYQGVLQVCNADQTGWVSTDCGDVNRCRTGPPPQCGPCAENEYQCNGAELQRCNKDLAWEKAQVCDTAALCSKTLTTKAELDAKGLSWNGACEAATCPSGGFRCNPDNQAQLQSCPPTRLGWENVSPTCLAPELCDPVAGKCKDGCVPGSYKCDGNKLLHCGANGQYDATPQATCATAAQCSVTKHACLDCVAGEVQCDGAKLRQCTTSQTWSPLGVCTTAALCDASVAERRKDCKPAGCTPPNTQQCDPQNPNVLQSCPATQLGWVTLDTCATAVLCNKDRTTCVAPTCKVGETRCSGQNHQVCSTDRSSWVTDKVCLSNQVCDLEKGCATCTLDQQRCNGASIEICKSDSVTRALSWQPLGKTCPTKELCKVSTSNVASCDAVTCDVGEHKCVNTLTLQVCNQGRTDWQTEKNCTAGQICDSLGGQCDTCVPKTYTCNGTALMKCSDDGQSYATVQDNCVECSTLADKSAGTCYVCKANSTRCSGTNLIQHCAADRKTWDPPSTCTNSYDCVRVDGQTDYCAMCPVANEVACVQTSSPGSTHKCSADRASWGTTTNCTQGFGCVAVNPGNDYCASACVPNETKCADATSVHSCDSQGKGWGPSTSECADETSLEACVNGELSSTSKVACPSNTPYCDAGRCVACVGTISSCADSNTSRTCDNGNWASAACNSSTPYCVGNGSCVECTSSSIASCPTSNSRKYCSANTWTTEDCTATTPYCQGGQCVACTGSSVASCASDTKRKYCFESSWTTEDCSGTTPACYNGNCTECNASTVATCQSDTVRKYCVNGAFATTTCDGACSGGTCVDCQTGAAPTCSSATQAKVCVNNTWELTNCTGATPACVAGQCVECVNSAEWICDPTDVTLLKHCNNNVWQTSHCTGTDEVCEAGACVTKTPPDAGVDAGQTGAAGSG